MVATYRPPGVQMYAASFFVIPALRWLLNQQRNLSLQTANRIRLDRLRELREPDPALQQKLLSAQKQAQRTVIRCRTRPFDQTDRHHGSRPPSRAAPAPLICPLPSRQPAVPSGRLQTLPP